MKMIINGKQVDAVKGEISEVSNPATGKLVDTIPRAGEEDVLLAIESAVAGQKKWAKVPIHQRGEILMRFLTLVDADKESLARLLSDETGKPITEARNEIANIPIGFKGFIERAKHLYGTTIPNGTEAGQEATMQIIVREPVGVVACIIPFNFPCDLFDQKVAPALMMGNAAIVMPSSSNPLTLTRLTGLLVDAGVSDGAIQCLTGPGRIIGPLVITNPDVDLITLTGSTEVGIEAAKGAAGHLAHVALELGGNDAFILLEDGDVDLAVAEMVWGRLYNTGQVCCASKRFVIHNARKDEFVAKTIEAMKGRICGDPSLEETQIGCLVSESAARTVEEQVNLTVLQGGKVVYGGKRNGAFYEPTVIIDIPKTADVATDLEIFGPVVSIIGFDTEEEAIEIANSSKFGLSSCVFTKDMNKAFKVASQMEAGVAVINGASFFRSFEMPFGGYKYSGIGTEGVSSTLEEMSKVKTIVLKNVLA